MVFPEEAWRKEKVDPKSASSDGVEADEDLLPVIMPKPQKILLHQYMSFGIENNLLGKAVGMIHQHQYQQLLKVLDGIDRNLLTQPFKNFIDQEKEASRKVLFKNGRDSS